MGQSTPNVKKQILNQLLAQDQQALELYVAAHDVHVVIKDNRMVTQKKLLVGLTQWAKSASNRRTKRPTKSSIHLFISFDCSLVRNAEGNHLVRASG